MKLFEESYNKLMVFLNNILSVVIKFRFLFSNKFVTEYFEWLYYDFCIAGLIYDNKADVEDCKERLSNTVTSLS